MFQTPVHPTKTKRIVLAQVSLCNGCCCGAVHRGKPEVPIDWMKDQWKQRGLKKSMQLTISGCVGPCDLPNVVSISSAEQTIWLGSLREFAQYGALLQWAVASRDAGHPLPLPSELSELQFDPFRRADSLPVVSAVIESQALDSEVQTFS